MADRGAPERELVFCHQCQNEWHRDQGGLVCPDCHSDFTEIIERDSDPRDTHSDEPPQPPQASELLPPLHPLHEHNPWGPQTSGSDDDGTRRFTWSAGPAGVRYTSTFYGSSTDGTRPTGPPMNDPFMPLFQNFASMVHGIIGPSAGGPNTGREGNSRERESGPGSMRGAPDPPSAVFPMPNSQPQGAGREGFGGRNVYTTTGRLWPRDAYSPQPPMRPVDDLHGFVTAGHPHMDEPLGLFPPDRLLSQLFQQLAPVGQGGAPGARGEGLDGPGGPLGGPFAILARMLNPANAASGDAVYSQEALDRVISQLMEQHAGGNAPGPATAAAIQALPKRKVDGSMMGENGLAECSICMDNVEVGAEVTFLPCNHWFHDDCVGAWLREHDTCPHCRQGIMPKEGQGDTARSPGQEPRNSRMPLSQGREGSMHNPFLVPESPMGGYPQRDDVNSRRDDRRSDYYRPDAGNRRGSARDGAGQGEGNSSGGGITGWVRNRFGGGGN